jgi:hypothetical protein
MKKVLLTIVMATCVAAVPGAQNDRYAGFDRVLDTYVRDGGVYYRALQKERVTLDRHLQSLDVGAAELAAWPAADRKAFWINAYNAFVLGTVIAHYPIRGTSNLYPRNSIRQVSGAFDRITHRVAGQMLTLDAMEQKMLGEFGDARIVLVLGRGAVDGGRLRSEPYRGERLEVQLQEMIRECAQRVSCVALDRQARTMTVTPLVGWRSEVFVQTFAAEAGYRWRSRSPIERALAAMLTPVVFASERDFLAEDMFQLKYGEFDWSLNEL